MKKIIAVIVLCFAINIQAQETAYQCPENFQVSDFTEYENVLQNYQQNLRNVRKWAREKNRQDIVWSTLRLEYWSNDMIRYIKKNKETNTDKACERLFKTDMHKFHDYLNLGLFYQHHPSLAPVDHSKYKK